LYVGYSLFEKQPNFISHRPYRKIPAHVWFPVHKLYLPKKTLNTWRSFFLLKSDIFGCLFAAFEFKFLEWN